MYQNAITTFFCCLLVSLIPIQGEAYNKDNHEHITQCAIKLLNEEFGPQFITDEEAKKIISGNRSEDSFGHKWIIRLWNQHFYNPEKPKELWSRNKSIDVRFERIAQRCFNKRKSKKFYYYVGEITHHIQDATNPAHVVPIYHGGSLKDTFDEQNVQKYLPNALAIPKSINYPEPYLLSILRPTAIKTLKSIHQKFKGEVLRSGKVKDTILDWSSFWKANHEDWFGCYGKLGNPKNGDRKRDNYLEETIIVDNAAYTINSEIYKAYSSQQIKLAVENTAAFIYYAKTRLRKE